MTVTYREPRSPDTPLYLPSNMATMLNELKRKPIFQLIACGLDKITEKFYDRQQSTRKSPRKRISFP